MAPLRPALYLGYAAPGTSPLTLVDQAREAEGLGYESVWVAEAWGTDTVSVLSWIAAKTRTIKVGASIMQISARTPAATAMTAATLDLLSEGRFILGLGASGPQVVEGWHGQPWRKPLTRMREHVDIVRRVLRREQLEYHGEYYDIPYSGEGATGLARPLKLLLHPARSEIDIYLASLGAKSVALAAEIAHGWLPVLLSPTRLREVFGRALDEGFARRQRAMREFDISASVPIVLTDDVQAGRDSLKPSLALYIGGMGSRRSNFFKTLVSRYGYEADAVRIQELYLESKRSEAAAAVPDALVDEVALVGSRERIAERLELWRASGVTTLRVETNDRRALRLMAELLL